MRVIPAELQAKLNSRVTTLCRCWVLTRRDGVVLGFTDHDEDISLGAINCMAGSGLEGSEATQELGLAVTATEISGVLANDTLNEADLAAGRYDGATVELYLVDWSDPSLNVLLGKGSVGEVRREGSTFTAELRGVADRLAQESGRLYTATCAADFGDSRCGVDLDNEDFRGTGGVAALGGTSNFAASGLEGFEEGCFTAGRLVWTDGANNALAVEVKRHRVEEGVAWLELWQAMPEPLAPGDTFIVTAGCDKRFATCRERFNNALNFRGFPHIPGNDFIASYAVDGEPGHDGASMQGET
jgi:uncharacterized phage protein (TIGR02218 family)